MSEPGQPISEIELHGYLDGELSEQRIVLVEAHLDDDEAASAKLYHFGIQGDLIRRLYGPLLNRSIPHPMAAELATVKQAEGRLAQPPHWLKLTVAAFLVVAIGLGVAAWHFGLPDVLLSLPVLG